MSHSPPPVVCVAEAAGNTTDTYGSTLSAQPSESQRRSSTNTSLQLIVWTGLPA